MSATTITGAALIAQFLICAIIAVGMVIIQITEGDVYWRQALNYSHMFLSIIFFSFLTLGLLLFSDAFATLWKPLIGNGNLYFLSWSIALFFVFIIDILWVCIMVSQTGGGKDSAFNPIFFLLPVLAIFLRQPIGRIFFYLFLIVVTFSFVVFKKFYFKEQKSNLSYRFVSLACFAVAAYIGIITRPN